MRTTMIKYLEHVNVPRISNFRYQGRELLPREALISFNTFDTCDYTLPQSVIANIEGTVRPQYFSKPLPVRHNST